VRWVRPVVRAEKGVLAVRPGKPVLDTRWRNRHVLAWHMAGATRPPIGAKALEERMRGVNHGAAIGMNRPCKASIIRRRDLRRTLWARRRVCTSRTGACVGS